MSDDETEEESPKATATVTNQRREKRKELLHTPGDAKDLGKDYKEQQRKAFPEDHFLAVTQKAIEMYMAAGEYLIFDVILGTLQMKNFVERVEFADGDQYQHANKMLDIGFEHAKHTMKAMKEVFNQQFEAVETFLHTQYGKDKGIINKTIGLADKGVRKGTLGVVGLRRQRRL